MKIRSDLHSDYTRELLITNESDFVFTVVNLFV